MKKVCVTMGTRPEAIKLALVIKALQNSDELEPYVCLTGQHNDLMASVLEWFDIPVHKRMFAGENSRHDPYCDDLFANCMSAARTMIQDVRPDLMMVQGDTYSVLAGAQAAYFAKIPVAHVEAGLRSGDKYNPFPEEGIRRMVSEIATYNFCPTAESFLNLNRTAKNSWLVGNTVIDALLMTRARIRAEAPGPLLPEYDTGDRTVLFTCHRRESWGNPMRKIFCGIHAFATMNPRWTIYYPMHPNPDIIKLAHEYFDELDNVILADADRYQDFVGIMDGCQFVITDSGGVQEEASTLGKPILVCRDATERPEILKAGGAILVGTDGTEILKHAEKLRTDSEYYDKMAQPRYLFGKGDAAERIVKILEKHIDD